MNLLQKYYQASPQTILEDFDIDVPNVPVYGIAKGLGIQVLGLVPLPKPNIPHIVVHVLPEPEQAYQFAKDLGSLLGHYDNERFANELLMPEWLLDFVYTRMNQNIHALAEIFKVPPTIMYERLKEIRLVS